MRKKLTLIMVSAVILCFFVLHTTSVFSASALSDSEITAIVEEYLSVVGTGRYWNANITSTATLKAQVDAKNYLDATTKSACVCSGTHIRANGCTSNNFTGVSHGVAQCWGFGDYMEYIIFKTTDGSSWTKNTSVNSNFKFRPGDLIWSQKNSSSQHIMVVYKTNSDGSVKIVEGNYGGKCYINTRTLSDPHSYVNYSSSSYVMSPPSSLRLPTDIPSEEPETDKTPGKPVFTTNRTVYKPNEEITVAWDKVELATNYWVTIYKDGERLESFGTDNATEVTKTFSTTGTYAFLVSSGNSNGGSGSATYRIIVTNDIPQKPVFTTNRTVYKPNEEITVAWDKVELATNYWVTIYKDGERLESFGTDNATEVTKTFSTTGTYAFLVSSGNSNGGSGSATFRFTITDNPIILSAVTKTNKAIEVETTVHNLVAPYDILIVGYKGNQFVTMKKVPHNEQNSPYTLEGDIDEIKVFVWDSLNGLKPLCEPEEITADEFVIE